MEMEMEMKMRMVKVNVALCTGALLLHLQIRIGSHLILGQLESTTCGVHYVHRVKKRISSSYEKRL